MFAVFIEQFHGPLHLLLELIEGQKLDVSEISLATVTDSYLKHLEANPAIPAEELADFLLVASKLLLIKSRVLLPFLAAPDDGEQSLESQLRIYKEYLEASKTIEAILAKKPFLFSHDKLPKIDVGFSPPVKFAATDMQAMFLAVIKRLEPVVRIPAAALEKTVTLHEKIKEIQQLLHRAGSASFRAIMKSAQSRSEVIVCFLALLELVKQRTVAVEQSDRFSDIAISRAELAAA